MYIGQTKNLSARLMLHNNKEFKKGYTTKFAGNWEIIYSEEKETRQEALKREKQLKSFRGREFIKNLVKHSGVAQR